MKKNDGIWKSALMFVAKGNIFKYILALIIVLLIPSAVILRNWYYEKMNTGKETEKVEEKNLTTGVINTEAEKGPISRYTLDDGFEEYKEESQNFNSTNNISTNNKIEDKSSLLGEDLVISEGSSFNVNKDLKLMATDKDGSDITDRISIERNDVNTSKPGDYKVKAYVRLSDGSRVEKEFLVTVKETNLEVAIESFGVEKKYVNKNDNISFNLELNVSKSHVSPVSAMINGTEYPVYKGKNSIFKIFSDKKRYNVNVKAENVVGKQEYKMSYIKMSDNTIITTENSETVEVLKEEAKVKNFTYEEESFAKRIRSKFSIEDVDNSSSNIRLEFYKGNQLIESIKLDKKDNYEVYLPTKSNGKYKVKVLVDTNLTQDEIEEYTIQNNVILEEFINISNIDQTAITGKSIEIIQGDSFEPINDLSIVAVDKDGQDITNKVVIDNKVDVDNPGKYEVKATVIKENGKEYSVRFQVTVKPIAEVVSFTPLKTEVNKGEQIELAIELKTLKDNVEAVSAVINNNEYNLVKDRTTSSYIAQLNGETSSGSKKYTLSKLKMKDGKEIKVNNISEVKVLRSLGRMIGNNENEELISDNSYDITTYSESTEKARASSGSGTVSGNDTETLNSSLKMTGTVKKDDGSAPAGKLEVEVPTRMTFTIDQAGNFTSGTYTISNKSSVPIEVSVAEFKETNTNGGITVKPRSEDISSLDRSNIHLELLADGSRVDLGEKSVQEKQLVEIAEGSSRTIFLVGESGKAKGTDVDNNGASEDFNFVFKIKKKK